MCGRPVLPLPVPPLDDARFAALMAAFAPFEDQPGIAVGVSGGPDSTALALLLQRWLAARRGQLLALVVDHRLRPDSAAEATAVAGRLQALGITARILTRQGPLPTAAVQATARAARYTLLAEATAAAGFLHLAVAHHRQDQRETMALRAAAGSGPRGLAGMPAVRELSRVQLIRPLLGVAPDQLKALLERRGIAWLEDPANRDPRFWRARFRAAEAAGAAPAGGAPTDPAMAADRAMAAAATARLRLDRQLAAWLAAHARPHPLGFIAVPARALAATPEPLLLPLLGRLIAATAGAIWPPPEAKLAPVRDWLRADGSRRLSLGGVLVERGARGLVRFVREPRAVAGPALLPAGGLLWDGRFRITWPGAECDSVVVKAGPGWRSRLGIAAVPAVVVETLPLISRAGLAVALGPKRLTATADAPTVRFRPRNPYADVPFGQSTAASVASSEECLIYGRA